MEFAEVLRRRKMVRNFTTAPVSPSALDAVVAAAQRVPSAGFSQGVEYVVLQDPAGTAAYWTATTTREWRDSTSRHGMMNAPVVILPLVRPAAYTERYGETDKSGSGLGSLEAWPVPYWWVDVSFSTMALLLAAVDNGIGAAFLGMFRGEEQLRDVLGIPPEYRCIGAVLLGHPAVPDPPSASLARGRRPLDEIVHHGRW